MKSIQSALVIILISASMLHAQQKPSASEIDMMLLRGDYEKAIDTCKQIIAYDSLNPEIYFKMGVAYQNLLNDEMSLGSFLKAAGLNPEKKIYSFMLAKGYYSKGKFSVAEPILENLCSADSMNWLYSYYLTSIYMQNEKYDEALDIYKRFLAYDSLNCTYLDKLAYAKLKKGDFENAASLYEKSLAINEKNIPAIKNLSYLYTAVYDVDTAILLLSNGIKIDSTDMDLYARRAQMNYTKNYTKRALDDYLVILATGDSSKLYLKRAGIGYCNNFQPKEGITYLLEAYERDSIDYETCSFLGQSYYKLKDYKNSIYYYDKVIQILAPLQQQMGLTFFLTAESQKAGGMYNDAILSYVNARNIRSDPGINMMIANIYDEKLNNRDKAIAYYQKFLNEISSKKPLYPSEYIEKIKKRIDYLKTKSTN